MYQYEFKIAKKGRGSMHSIFVTAQTQEKALAAVADYYADSFEIFETPIAAHRPHQYLGEIDATS